ncbi:MAG: phosphopentomutase [Oscillospiraceae bacterium]|nr:phosphopentomutase [Oscillospiraceae bacterium]
MGKRVFLIVLDSCGCGALPDADRFMDSGTHTIRALCNTGALYIPNLTRMGLFQIEGIGCGTPCDSPTAAYGKCGEKSAGKDTTTGHWEIAGLISDVPMKTYPNGFPEEVLEFIRRISGRDVLCNLPYSGTEVIADYGRQHLETGALIVYTSADSVLQIAAHESLVPVPELYRICQETRAFMQGEYAIGRIIARPFVGEYPHFTRTANRHDYSVAPFAPTILNRIQESGKQVISVGKIQDIFDGCGISEGYRTTSNDDGMGKTLQLTARDFEGLCFVNLVEFDSAYGHRRDAMGYTRALNAFDAQLGTLLPQLTEEDLLIITADHGCDPTAHGTDHTREYIPLLVWGKNIRPVSLGVRESFADIGQTACEWLNVSGASFAGTGFLSSIYSE